VNILVPKKIRGSAETVLKQIGLILTALGLTTLFLALSGYGPFAAVIGIINGLTGDIAGTIRWATPLILAGLAFCVGAKAGFFNLGIDGQLVMGAATGTMAALGTPPETPAAFALILVFLAAMAGGVFFALIPAVMKILLNTNEVVSTLLLNFVAQFFVEFLVIGPMRDPGETVNLNTSSVVPENTWLPRLTFLGPTTANAGIFIALAAAILLCFLFYKTTMGHEIKIAGANPLLAKYAGMRSNRITLLVMTISGAVSGLIGGIEVFAVQRRLLANFNPSFGFDGIVVALLGTNNPIGIVFSGVFFGALKNGGINMERATDVPSAVTRIVMAIIIIVISAKFSPPQLLRPFTRGRKK
jgi:simple sugar transport system permease protein